MKTYTQNGYCTVWGSKWGARRVAGLTKEERETIKDGGKIFLSGCPAVSGITDRVIIQKGGRFYTRMPEGAA